MGDIHCPLWAILVPESLDQKGDELAKQRSSTVQSVERAIAILKSFDQEKPERGVNELSRELGLHKSTVSRLMITLERGGLLSRNPETERYRLGVDLIGMAAQVVSYMDIRQVARPFLRQLAETCQETVNLAVLDAGQIVNLEQFVPPARQVKNIGRVGRRMCPHCTAAGKVLLAHLSQDELDRILQAGLDRFTPHTITDPHEMRQELMQVREQGYAVSQEELEEGLNVVAAPIYDHTGQMTASVSVAGPAYRVTPELFPELVARLMNTTAKISERLGYRG
jgi:IclR family KDG regulon transcriptional repressor